MIVGGIELSTELCYALGLGGIFFVIAVVWIVKRIDGSMTEKSEEQSEENHEVKQNGNTKGPVGDEKKKSIGKAALRQTKLSKKAANKVNFQHKWLSTTMKGHGATITDFDLSPNGKYLISCSEDRSCFMWSTKEFTSKEHKFVKGSVEYDHLSAVRFSPDSRAFIGALSNDSNIRIFKLAKKDDGSTQIVNSGDFPEKSKVDILNIGIASNGRFIMTCHTDTTIKIWSLKGDCYGTIDSRQMYNVQGSVSPCGRFVASCGFTSDVKVWEIVFDRGGTFKEIRRAFELVGHNAGVLSFDFNSDSTRMASVSKDGTWKLWDTNIEYAMGQDPYLLKSWNYSLGNSPSAHLSFAPNAMSVAISLGDRMLLMDVETGEGEEITYPDEVTCISFDTRSRYMIFSSGNRLHVLHNVIGLKARERQLTELHRSASTLGAKERHQEELKTIQETLKAVCSKI